MDIIKRGFIKDFRINLKAAEEEEQHIFKYLKKYYNNESYYFIISKLEHESVTIHKLEKLTSILFDNLDIMYYRWHKVEELKPAEARGYNQTQRENVNNYDLKNDWDFKYSNIIILALKNYNNHNKNNYDAKYIYNLYNNRKNELLKKAISIRAEKARAERERKRQEAEATTAQFKKDYLIKLNRIIKATFEVESIKADDNMQNLKDLITFKNRIIEKNIISVEMQRLLLVSDLFKNYTTTCETLADNASTTYKTEYTTTLLNYLLKGCYSLMLNNFEKCNNCDWYNNTRLFKIIKSDLPCDPELLHYDFK